jgi:drug/metabolite transporter (DMT)-like permease
MSRRGWILFLALGLIWGIPYFFIKVAVNDFSPMFIVAGRLALAAVILLPLAFVTQRSALTQVLARWPVVAALALIEIMIPFGLLTWAETEVSSSLAGLVIAAVPTFNAGLAAALGLSDRLDRRRALGLAIGLLGVAVLLGVDLSAGSALAVLALLGVAVGYASGPIIINTRLQDLPGLPVMAVMAVMAVATTIAALPYLPWLVSARPTQPASGSAWASVLMLGVVCTAVAFLVLFALVAEVGATRATLITYINPVVAVTLGVVVLAEPLSLGMLLGFPMILLGSYIATRPSTHPRSPVDSLEGV